MRISSVDYATIIIYLAGIVCLGIWAGYRRRKGGEGSHYFLAGNTLTWPIIGLAMFAANISTVHLVSLAESAYKYGLIYGNFEWMAGFTLILLSLFFAPLYLRSKVPTLPDYLERRFNRNCRDWLAVISIISAIVIHIGVALYTAAWVLRGIMNIPPNATIVGIDALMFFIIILGVLTGIYTMIGGLLAVVMTESVQTILLLVGAVCITIVGYVEIGGWNNLVHTLQTQPHPMARSGINWSTSNFLKMLRFPGDPSGLPWYSILLGYPVLGIWYWCCDQTIVQRVLAAKDEKHARLGPLFCAFIKILPVFFFVLPGVICVALVQNNFFNGDAPFSAADTYTFMITHMLPIGLKGLIAAAMLAAAMQTCSAALNSTATLFSYDIFKRWRPAASDHSLVVIGKITTIVATILAIILSPIFGHYSTIIEGLNKLISYIAPPITAVFLFGVFWKRASGKAAFITLISGAAIGLLIFFLDWNGLYKGNFMMTAFYLLIICCVTIVIFSFIFPESLKTEAKGLVWENWKEPLRGEAKGHALGNYKILSAAVFITFILLYYLFR
ncbi:MAG TPA: sodium/solute symporter [Ignavibacteriaceae bacterium]|nr:sodium/solute symporter [Ignavibacteriaceae bacterium]